MKTKLTSLVMLLFVICNGYGQSYEPLVRENAHWVVADLDDWPVWHNVNFREYYTDGDTLLDDTLYKKVYKYTLAASNIWGDPPYERMGNPSIYALLREDTIARIVYGLRFNVGPEYCFYTEDTLFDFSVSQYDTLELCIGYMYPLTFDTVYYDNIFGYYRKHFITDMASDLVSEFYEGIGSASGLFEGIGISFKKDLRGSELICYTLGDISNCDVLTQNREEIALDINLYPNPAMNYIKVELNKTNHSGTSLALFDTSGKIIKAVQIPAQTQDYVLGLQDIPTGLYVVKVDCNGKSIGYKKFSIVK